MASRTIKDLVDSILADGQITRAEQELLNRTILQDGKITPEERSEIDRIMDLVVRGEIKAVP